MGIASYETCELKVEKRNHRTVCIILEIKKHVILFYLIIEDIGLNRSCFSNKKGGRERASYA